VSQQIPPIHLAKFHNKNFQQNLEAPMQPLVLLRRLLVLLVALPSLAYGQGSTVYQNGTAVANHISKFVTNGRIADVGTILGDGNGFGVSPFGITDGNSLGLCSYTGSTQSSAYRSLCLGHDQNGNAILQVTGGGSFLIDINGVPLPVPGSASGLPTIADNATLTATPHTYAAMLVRQDHTIALGAPPTFYRSSAAPCSLNAGNGDGGSQVKASDGGCWLASFVAIAVDVRIWGASPNNLDNTAQLEAALNALSNTGSVMLITGGVYKTNGLTASGNVRISQLGQGAGTSLANRDCAVGLRQLTANQTTLSITGDGVTVDGLCIDNKGLANTGGAGISLGSGSNMAVKYVQVSGACIPLDVSGGDSAHQNLTTVVDSSTFMPADASGCVGVRVGKNSTNGATTNLVINNSNIYCFPAPNPPSTFHHAEGLLVHDVGAFYMYGSGIVGCVNGTHVNPLIAGQGVNDMQVNGGVVGDSDSQSSLVIDTGAAGTAVTHMSFNGTWFANHPKFPPYPVISIKNTGAGNVGNIRFTGSRILAPEAADGVQALAGRDLTFDNNQICNRGTVNNFSLLVLGKINRAAIRDNTFGTCDQQNPGLITNGVAFAAGSTFDSVQIVGNTFNSVTNPVLNPSFVPINGIVQVRNNIGIDEITPTVPSASAITVPINPVFYITGTTNIGSLVWSGGATTRTIIPATGAAFTWGATNICGTPPAAVANVPLFATYDGICWRLK
jgi:hypothetical protein